MPGHGAEIAKAGPPPPEIKVRIASDGMPLHYRHWLSKETPPRGWLLVLHGIQSHSGWYEYSGGEFARAGWDVRIPDRRGSGLNTVARGDACHWKRLAADVRHFLNDIHHERQQQGGTGPVLLAGISWGAKLAFLQALQNERRIHGLTLMTPGLCPLIRPGPFDRFRLCLARRLGIEERLVPIPLNDPALFTSLPDQQQNIAEDPLALHKVNVRFLFADQDLDRECRRPGTVPIPVLLLLAGRDQIIDHDRTVQFLNNRTRTNLEVRTYPGVAHTLELETCRRDFVRDWMTWAGQFR